MCPSLSHLYSATVLMALDRKSVNSSVNSVLGTNPAYRCFVNMWDFWILVFCHYPRVLRTCLYLSLILRPRCTHGMINLYLQKATQPRAYHKDMLLSENGSDSWLVHLTVLKDGAVSLNVYLFNLTCRVISFIHILRIAACLFVASQLRNSYWLLNHWADERKLNYNTRSWWYCECLCASTLALVGLLMRVFMSVYFQGPLVEACVFWNDGPYPRTKHLREFADTNAYMKIEANSASVPPVMLLGLCIMIMAIALQYSFFLSCMPANSGQFMKMFEPLLEAWLADGSSIVLIVCLRLTMFMPLSAKSNSAINCDTCYP